MTTGAARGQGRPRSVRFAREGARLGLAASVEWRNDQFPHLLQWMNLRAGAYGFGVEPSTHHVGGQQAARDDGSMIWLQHGETRAYDTTISLLTGADDIAAAVAGVQAVRRQPLGPNPLPAAAAASDG